MTAVNSTHVAARVRDARLRTGLSQTEFAAWGGVSRASQFSYESGRSAPDTNYLQRLAEHGVDATYILTGVRQELAVEGWAAELLDLATRLDQPARDALLLLVRRMTGDTQMPSASPMHERSD